MELSQFGIFQSGKRSSSKNHPFQFSIFRFWTNEQGEKIFNPFLICLNLLESKSTSVDPVEVTYKFGIYNRAEEQYDEGPEGVTSVVLKRSDQIQSVGVENVTLQDENYNEDGDILLKVW